jgi:plastocyanin
LDQLLEKWNKTDAAAVYKNASALKVALAERIEIMQRNKIWRASLALSMMMGFLLLAISANTTARAQQQSPAKTAEVKIDNFSFGPAAVTVAVGTTITWTNHDDIPHTVVSTDGVFKSKVLDTDEKFTFTFDKAGTYPYFCSIHPKMTGKVIVQ